MIDYSITAVRQNEVHSTTQTDNQRLQRTFLSQKPDEVCFSRANQPPTLGRVLAKMFLGAVESTLKIKLTDEELKTTQTKFQQLFLRDDISLEDTKRMIQEYQDADKIKDKKEYAEKMFELAKKNYGFGDIDLPMRIIKGKSFGNNKKQGGGMPRTISHVDIDIDSDKQTIAGIIHHELRHAKQYYYSTCLDPQQYFRSAIIAGFKEMEATGVLKKGEMDYDNINQSIIDYNIDQTTKRWGELTPDKVPEKHKIWASIMLDTLKDYVAAEDNHEAYYNHLHEKDARLAEAMIKNILKMIQNKIV